jgi:aminoglycoside 6-adenylyltransferase
MHGKPGDAKEICAARARRTNAERMTAQEIEQRIVEWARSHPDVEALVQIGSRAQPHGHVDVWSDWDFHLYTPNPDHFRKDDWPAQIAPCWSTLVERTERRVTKVSVLFAGGFEVDFVPLAAWQMKLVYWAMARPALSGLYPAVLRQGIANTRLIVRPGYQVILGDSAWTRRLAALAVPWPDRQVSADDFLHHNRAFWRHAVWVQKKICRGEVRAALRWNQREVMEHLLALLEEEARLAGRAARPEARKAEQWLDDRRLAQTGIPVAPDQRALARALLAEMALFEEVSRSVAQSRGFALPDDAAVAAWLRSELTPLAGPT